MDELITLIDEEGMEHQFAVEAFLDLDDEKYAVLLPVCDEYDTDEAVIMRFGVDENGEEVLYDIDSDEEWEKVADAYDEISAEDDRFQN
ncbi:MAG: DUF1292 domain-containing protein [Firmicutes bacterium]|nr:DUF1292 domain-containing protein [Bacillota bacterium]